MNSAEEIKRLVNQKYSEIARGESDQALDCSCGCGTNNQGVSVIMNESYHDLKGYEMDADLQLGCGLPTQFAQISPGDIVVDLGSGAGNDCFVARAETGENGEVIGLDFSDEMLQRARQNAEKLGFSNVRFIRGDIEDIPLKGSTADVVVSNCVINLVPDKQRVYDEIYRILVPGGHFSISDVVREGELPEAILQAAEMYAGCIAGAMERKAYLNTISSAGFEDIVIQKDFPIYIPEDVMHQYLTPEEVKTFSESENGLFSITVFGRKPLNEPCCSGCNC